jgi:hypothetical protein
MPPVRFIKSDSVVPAVLVSAITVHDPLGRPLLAERRLAVNRADVGVLVVYGRPGDEEDTRSKAPSERYLCNPSPRQQIVAAEALGGKMGSRPIISYLHEPVHVRP